MFFGNFRPLNTCHLYLTLLPLNTDIVLEQCIIMQGWIFPFKGSDFENCVDILNEDFGSVDILVNRVGAGQGL